MCQSLLGPPLSHQLPLQLQQTASCACACAGVRGVGRWVLRLERWWQSWHVSDSGQGISACARRWSLTRAAAGCRWMAVQGSCAAREGDAVHRPGCCVDNRANATCGQEHSPAGLVGEVHSCCCAPVNVRRLPLCKLSVQQHVRCLLQSLGWRGGRAWCRGDACVCAWGGGH